jgi:arylsulfatase A-like enzyme
MSVYGYERRNTPNLEKLAAESEVYTRAVAAGDMTLSTHGSLFTGLFPSSHHAHYAEETPPLAADFQTLAESLRDKGYFTAAVVSNFGFLGYDFGLDQGFTHYDASEPVTPLTGGFPAYCLRTAIRDAAARFAHHSLLDIRSRNAAQINQAVFKVLESSRENGRSPFLFINYMDAHWPYMPPPPFDKLYPGKDDSFSTVRFNALRDDVNSGRRLSTETERAHLISQYDGGIAYLDAEVGKLLDYLKRTGMYDQALIMVTSDHGESFGERGVMEHGVSVYQDQVWVPLIVKYPKRNRKRVIEYPVSLVDVMPTVLDLLGFPIPAGVQGVSLRAESSRARRVFAESFAYVEYMKLYPRFRRIERATYAGPRKLVVSTTGKRELYDLQTDPGERRNILQTGENATEARILEVELAQWLKTQGKAPGKTPKMDSATLERLKSLGYVQ